MASPRADRTDTGTIVREYLRLAASVDVATARIRERHPSEVHCHARCNLCCHDVFPMTILEAAVVRMAFERLPADVASAIGRRTQDIDRELAIRSLDFPTSGHFLEGDREVRRTMIQSRFALKTSPAGMCPLNVDGLCTVYAYRPLLCRAFGYPTDDIAFGCPGGNFANADGRYMRLQEKKIHARRDELARAFVAGTSLEGRMTDNRHAASVDWGRLLALPAGSS